MDALRRAGRLPLIVLSSCSGAAGRHRGAGRRAHRAGRGPGDRDAHHRHRHLRHRPGRGLYTALDTHPADPVARALAGARHDIEQTSTRKPAPA